MDKNRWLTAGALVAALTLGGVAQSDPAKIAPSENAATRAFGDFARSWMSDMKKREVTHRHRPTIEGPGLASYVGYSPKWDMEVKATGDSISPYVGVLRYQEQLYTCRDETTRDCKVSRTTPVTEVFAFREGGWKY